jgi:hypothetical protein
MHAVCELFGSGQEALGSGSTVLVAKNLAFAWRNDRDKAARVLNVYAPVGFEQFFADYAHGIGKTDFTHGGAVGTATGAPR